MIHQTTSGDVTLTQIDYSTEPGPFYYVVIDDTPMSPDMPLPWALAEQELARSRAEAEPGETVELVECGDEDLAWAGVSPAGRDGGSADG